MQPRERGSHEGRIHVLVLGAVPVEYCGPLTAIFGKAGAMAKYLWKVSYSSDGLKGLVKEGGTKRRAAVDRLTEGLGGKLESFYYALGDDDAFVIVDLPDNISAVAVSLAVNSVGAVQIKTVPLLSPEELDEASKKSVDYTPPGG